MRAGFKVAAAGLAIVLGCGAVALSPVEWPFPPQANPLTATAASESTAADAARAEVAPTYDYGYTDGVYRSEGQGKFGAVAVKVVIENGSISSIALGANNEAAAMLQKAQNEVIPQILDRQSVVNIDAATGATATSEAIIEAVGNVLERARA